MPPRTTYTILEAGGVAFRTHDADRAESAARAGMAVKAVTEGGD